MLYLTGDLGFQAFHCWQDTRLASRIFDTDLLTLSCFMIYLFGVVWDFRILRFERSFVGVSLVTCGLGLGSQLPAHS